MKVKFMVLMTQNANINKFMRIADLLQKGEGIYQWHEITIKFKDGIVVDDDKIEATKANLKISIEQAGGEVSKIVFIEKIESEGGYAC